MSQILPSLRRLVFPLELAGARLAAGGRRLVLVGVGVVAGAAVLAAVLAGRLVMQDRALALAVRQLDPGDRQIAVYWDGAADTFAQLNRFVAPDLEHATGVQPSAAMLFSEASIQRRLVWVRAANDLDRYVRLISGRLPLTCVPSHCEVLRLEGAGPIPSTPGLRLIQVGRAALRPDAPFASFVLPTPQSSLVAQAVRYHTPQPAPVVIADGIVGLSANTELETFYRSYGWFVPIAGTQVHPWSIGAFQSMVSRLTAQIEARSDAIEVDAPTQQLSQAAASSTVAARRLLLLGGEGGALLLAFTILAAAALRRDVGDARRRLLWFGAKRWQVELHTLTESLCLTVLGTALGWALGAAAGAAIAARAGSPAGAVVEHSLLSAGGLETAAAVAAGAGLLLYATVRTPGVQLGRLAVTPLDVAAAAAVGAVLVGLARGSVGSQQLTGGEGTSAFLILVPALIVFAATVVAARLLAPTLRALGRAGRRGPVALRLAAASLARNPGRAAIAGTFLVASLGLALFAFAYRATLVQGQQDEASFDVPASFVASEDLLQLVPVLHGAPLADYPGTTSQVLQLSGNVPAGAPFTFLGLAPDELARIGGWRTDFASRSRAQLASLLAPAGPVALRTLRLPPGRELTLPVHLLTGQDVVVHAWFRSPLGDFQSVSLGTTDGRRTVVLHGQIPFAHATLARLELVLPPSGRGYAANGGVGIQPSATGQLAFGVPRVDGVAVASPFRDWVATGALSGSAARLAYVLTPDRVAAFRPRQPTDGRALPVLATPAVAAAAGPGGVLPLAIEGEQITARVVGIVRRFPSANGAAVVADRVQAATLLDTASPGLGTTDQVWVNVAHRDEAAAAARLARAPFTQLTIQAQAAALAGLRDDPLARGALITLAGTAAVALALALLGLLLAVVGDVRDDRGELFDLEAQGAAPATIRAQLRARAALVAAFGLAGGVVLGAILASLVVSLVSVTAGAEQPQPPLRLALDLPLVALAILAYAALAVVVVAAATALRGRAPERAAELA